MADVISTRRHTGNIRNADNILAQIRRRVAANVNRINANRTEIRR